MKHAAVTGATPTTGLNGRSRRMTETVGFPRACLVRAEHGAAQMAVAGNSFCVFFMCVSGVLFLVQNHTDLQSRQTLKCILHAFNVMQVLPLRSRPGISSSANDKVL